jgi:hypothetical protein
MPEAQEVHGKDPKAPRGAPVEQVRVEYTHPPLLPGHVVRAYWRSSAAELREDGPSGDPNRDNMRIRVGAVTVPVHTSAKTGGGDRMIRGTGLGASRFKPQAF